MYNISWNHAKVKNLDMTSPFFKNFLPILFLIKEEITKEMSEGEWDYLESNVFLLEYTFIRGIWGSHHFWRREAWEANELLTAYLFYYLWGKANLPVQTGELTCQGQFRLNHLVDG